MVKKVTTMERGTTISTAVARPDKNMIAIEVNGKKHLVIRGSNLEETMNRLTEQEGLRNFRVRQFIIDMEEFSDISPENAPATIEVPYQVIPYDSPA